MNNSGKKSTRSTLRFRENLVPLKSMKRIIETSQYRKTTNRHHFRCYFWRERRRLLQTEPDFMKKIRLFSLCQITLSRFFWKKTQKKRLVMEFFAWKVLSTLSIVLVFLTCSPDWSDPCHQQQHNRPKENGSATNFRCNALNFPFPFRRFLVTPTGKSQFCQIHLVFLIQRSRNFHCLFYEIHGVFFPESKSRKNLKKSFKIISWFCQRKMDHQIIISPLSL